MGSGTFWIDRNMGDKVLHWGVPVVSRRQGEAYEDEIDGGVLVLLYRRDGNTK